MSGRPTYWAQLRRQKCCQTTKFLNVSRHRLCKTSCAGFQSPDTSKSPVCGLWIREEICDHSSYWFIICESCYFLSLCLMWFVPWLLYASSAGWGFASEQGNRLRSIRSGMTRLGYLLIDSSDASLCYKNLGLVYQGNLPILLINGFAFVFWCLFVSSETFVWWEIYLLNISF